MLSRHLKDLLKGVKDRHSCRNEIIVLFEQYNMRNLAVDKALCCTKYIILQVIVTE